MVYPDFWLWLIYMVIPILMHGLGPVKGAWKWAWYKWNVMLTDICENLSDIQGIVIDIFLMFMQLFLGIIICMMSLHMYFAPANMLIDLQVAYRAEPEMKNEVIIEQRTAS